MRIHPVAPFLILILPLLALPSCEGCESAPPVVPAAGPVPQKSETPTDTTPAPRVDLHGLAPDTQVVCPVCGLTFAAREAVATHQARGRWHYFLLEDHAQAFAAEPEAYLSGRRPDAGADAGPTDTTPPPIR